MNGLSSRPDVVSTPEETLMSTIRRLQLLAISAALASMSLAGCVDKEEELTEEVSCELMLTDVDERITANADRSSPAGKGDLDDRHLLVELVPIEGGNGGTVRFIPRRDDEYILGLDREVPLTIRGPEVEDESVEANDECPDIIPRQHIVEVEAFRELRLIFGPTSASEVELVVVEEIDFLHHHF